MRTRSRASRLKCILASFVVGPLTVSGLAGAQDIAAAEALFNSGLADMKAGRYDTGCKAIAESQRLDPRPGTLFTLATCEAEWGHIATAVTRYGDYLTVYEGLPDDRKAAHAARYKLAQEAQAKLTPDVPQLTISLPKGAPTGTIVKRDGQVVAEAALGLAIPVDPGPHVLSTQTPGGAVLEQPITISKGEKKQVTVEVKANVVSPAPASARTGTVIAGNGTESAEKASPGPSGRRVVTYVIGGAGVAGLVAGGVLGGLAIAQKGVLDQHCGAAVGQGDSTACDPTGLNASKSANSMALGSTIGLAVGGAAAATAVVLLVTERKGASPGTRAPTTGQGGRWVAAGPLSVGPSGGVFGVRGVW